MYIDKRLVGSGLGGGSIPLICSLKTVVNCHRLFVEERRNNKGR